MNYIFYQIIDVQTEVISLLRLVKTWRSAITERPRCRMRYTTVLAKSGRLERGGSNIAFHLKEVCYKVSLYKNCQWRTCNAFIGLSTNVKMIGGMSPCTRKFGRSSPTSLQNRDFQSYFRS